MEPRNTWLLVPAALAALLAVLACIANVAPRRFEDAGFTVEADADLGDMVPADAVANDRVQLQDADGRRSAPQSLAALTANTVVLQFEAALAGQDVEVDVRGAGAAVLLRGTFTLRADATLPLVGLPAGHCAVTATSAAGVSIRAAVEVPAAGPCAVRMTALNAGR
jgi:hypothetical protein